MAALVRRDDDTRVREFWLAPLADIAVPVDAAVLAAGDDVPLSIAVPIGDYGVRMIAGHLKVLAIDLDPLVGGRIGRLFARSLVAADEHLAFIGADENVQIAIVIPIDERNPASERLNRILLIRHADDRLVALIF